MTTFKGPSRKFFARFASVRKVNVEVEPFLVTTNFEVGGKKTKLASSQTKRLNEIAGKILDEFEDRMHDVILDKDKEIQKLLDAAEKKKDQPAIEKAQKQGQKIADDTLTSIKSSAGQIEKLLQIEVGKAFKKEKIFKELNTEFKIKVGYRITKSTISLTKNIAVTAVAPVNPKAWYNMGKAVYTIGSQIYDAAKSEQKLRQELFEKIAKHTTQQLKLWEQVPGNDSLLKKFQRWRTDTAKNLEQARKRYDVDLGGKIKKVDSLSMKLDGARKMLNDELKKTSAGLKEGIPAGKALMDMQRKLSGYSSALAKQREFADDMAMLINEMGVSVDRRSFQEKLRTLKAKPQDIVAMAKDVYDTATDAKKMIEAIVGAL